MIKTSSDFYDEMDDEIFGRKWLYPITQFSSERKLKKS